MLKDQQKNNPRRKIVSHSNNGKKVINTYSFCEGALVLRQNWLSLKVIKGEVLESKGNTDILKPS